MSMKLEVTLKTEDAEPKTGDFAIWETENNERHIVRVRANDHGRVYFNFNGSDHGDYSSNLTVIGTLISEPQPGPLRWIENCKPDKPGLWARPGATGSIGVVTVVTTEGLRSSLWEPATRCYLGPIPEILPPKKKVVQRLWLMKLGTSGWPATYDEQWVDDTHPDPEDGNWIRTDETREVEQ